MHSVKFAPAALLLGGAMVGMVALQAQRPVDNARLDEAVSLVMRQGGTPGATAGILRKDGIVYLHAFGDAVLPERHNTAVPMESGMALPIGSNSKLFTATCILLLQEHGQLSLDDPVARWFPELTRAGEVTIRNLLTHTSGYRDAAPQAYTLPMVRKPIAPLTLVHRWAEQPLDFEPGTRYEYSNTNYTILALIVERVSGRRFHDFLWRNVIEPLHLEGVLDLDEPGGRHGLRVQGYERFALGPMRPDHLEAAGWYYGAGELAMPVSTLLAWDRSILKRRLLTDASYDAMETDHRLKDGTPTGYGFGLHVAQLPDGRKLLRHGGVVSGFISENVLLPEDETAYAALTNDYVNGAAAITSALRNAVETGTPYRLPTSNFAGQKHSDAPDADEQEARVFKFLQALRQGIVRRSMLTQDTNDYFSMTAVRDFKSSLQRLGLLRTVELVEEDPESGMRFCVFRLHFANGIARLSIYLTPDHRFEQFLLSKAH